MPSFLYMPNPNPILAWMRDSLPNVKVDAYFTDSTWSFEQDALKWFQFRCYWLPQ